MRLHRFNKLSSNIFTNFLYLCVEVEELSSVSESKTEREAVASEFNRCSSRRRPQRNTSTRNDSNMLEHGFGYYFLLGLSFYPTGAC